MLFLHGVLPAQDRGIRRSVRLYFEFFRSSRMEKFTVKVVKRKLTGGKGVQFIERFLVVKCACVRVKIGGKEFGGGVC